MKISNNKTTKIIKSMVVTLIFAITILQYIGMKNVYAENVSIKETEAEDNGEHTKSNIIQLNKMYKGLLDKGSDVDFYSFTTTEKGYFTIDFSKDANVMEENCKNGWKYTVYDGDLNVIKVIEGIVGKKHTSPVFAYEKGAKFYIKVEAQNAYYLFAPTDCLYNLKVTQVSNNYFESEYNDEYKNADKITLNKTYKGLLHNGSDIDWYKFTLGNSGEVSIKFSKDSKALSDLVSSGWRVSLYKQTDIGTAISEYKNITSSVNFSKLKLSKGTYYVKVIPQESYYLFAPTDCLYNVIVNYSFSKPSIKSPELVDGPGIKIKWDKLEGISSYEVYRSAKSTTGFVKIATKSSQYTWYTDKTVTCGRTYYYKIKAYGTVDGKKVSSVWSNVKAKKANLLTPEITGLSNYKSKTALIKWRKIAGASGYEIYMSSSKNGNYTKVKTVGSNITSADILNRTKGKTYYFKVRAYKMINGNKVKSELSQVKSLKIVK